MFDVMRTLMDGLTNSGCAFCKIRHEDCVRHGSPRYCAGLIDFPSERVERRERVDGVWEANPGYIFDPPGTWEIDAA